MKRLVSLLATVMFAAMIFVTPVMASDVCSLSDGTECEIWMFHDNAGHWNACVNHKDAQGNVTVVGEVEAHSFKEGICEICEAKESNGAGAYSYLFVFIVVVGIGFLISSRSQKSFKKNNFEEHPFGLDKFRKF